MQNSHVKKILTYVNNEVELKMIKTYVINNQEVISMPGGDRTGPMGAGPMTGRGMGNCTGVGAVRYGAGRGMGAGFGYVCRRGNGRGFGRGYGFGRGFGRGYIVEQDYGRMPKEILEEQKEILREQIEAIEKQLKNI